MDGQGQGRRRLSGRPADPPGRRRRAGADSAARRDDHRGTIAGAGDLASTEFGSSLIELTSRGNVQIRGMRDTAGVAGILSARGAAAVGHPRDGPATSWRRRCPGAPAALPTCGRGWPTWTRRIQAEPVLAALPGRFWFSLDDGRGDVSACVPTPVCRCSTSTPSRCCWPGWTPECGCPPMRRCRRSSRSPSGSSRSREKRWRIAELDDTALP